MTIQLVITALAAAAVVFSAAGLVIEKNHCRRVGRRQIKLIILPVVSCKGVLQAGRPVRAVKMVYSSLVISIPYFKIIRAAWKKIFDSDLEVYEKLIETARQEAILRIKEKTPDADIIINLRIEASSIAPGLIFPIPCFDILAYGTAVTYEGKSQKRIKETWRAKKEL